MVIAIANNLNIKENCMDYSRKLIKEEKLDQEKINEKVTKVLEEVKMLSEQGQQASELLKN